MTNRTKTYSLTVDDFVIYHKTYQVSATSKAEAIRKFKEGEWDDSHGEDTTFHKSVVRRTENHS